LESLRIVGGDRKSGVNRLTNGLLIILGVLFMIAAFKTRGFVPRWWRGKGPIHPITRTGRVIIFLTGVAAILAAFGVISK
jgi:uncharacterized membrane protein